MHIESHPAEHLEGDCRMRRENHLTGSSVTLLIRITLRTITVDFYFNVLNFNHAKLDVFDIILSPSKPLAINFHAHFPIVCSSKNMKHILHAK